MLRAPKSKRQRLQIQDTTDADKDSLSEALKRTNETTRGGNKFIPRIISRNELPRHVKCPLCRDLLSDCVVVFCCGNSFCKQCIMRALHPQNICPSCQQHPKRVVNNNNLEIYVKNFAKKVGYNRYEWKDIAFLPKNLGTILMVTNESTFHLAKESGYNPYGYLWKDITFFPQRIWVQSLWIQMKGRYIFLPRNLGTILTVTNERTLHIFP